jgi:DNA-binding beta-propeller fold protein YncE
MRFNYFRLILGGVAAFAAAGASAAEILASNFFGDNIGRYDMNSGAFLGTYTGGTIDGPLATRVGPDGSLYVCSEANNSIQRFDLNTHAYLNTFINGTGLSSPTGITFDANGNALVANFGNSSISKYNSAGAFQGTLVASGSNGLNGPDVGTVIGPDGKLYVPSFDSNSILRFDASTGAFLDTFASGGALTQPRTILFRDNLVWVTSDNGNKVLRYNLNGTLFDTFVTAGSGTLLGASGMLFGDDNLLYVTSWRNNKILRYSMVDGSFVSVFAAGGNLNGPTWITQVPEPGTLAGIGIGLAAVSLRWRKRKRTK